MPIRALVVLSLLIGFPGTVPVRGDAAEDSKRVTPDRVDTELIDTELIDKAFTARNDGTEQRYVLRLPKSYQPAARHDLLIALHGHGSDRWQFARDARDECRAARDVAERHQMIFVSPDYRARTSWMGPLAEQDLVQILEELRANYRIGRVMLSGGSMGGTSALTFAVLHPEWIDGVVALNGLANHIEYDQFQPAIAESFGGTKTDKLDEYKKRSAEYWPERLTMPCGLTTGGQDKLVPPESVQRLAKVLGILGRDVLLIHRPDGPHATNYEDSIRAFEFVLTHWRDKPRTP